MQRKLIFMSLCILFIAFSLSAQTTWTVDDDGGADFTNIQDAIDAAAPGDTISVAPGTYVENLTITKSLVLTTSSGFLARDTIIDGGLAGRVIDVRGTESTPIAVTVEGFVIKNGLAAYGAAPGDPLDGSGAGIGTRYATMIIRGNQIKDNGFTPGNPCLPATLWGGGISLDSGSGSIIEANFIEGNNAADYTVGGPCYWDAWGWGGGIAIILSDDVLVANNFITDNWTVYDGAGIFVGNATVAVIHNTIRRNAIDDWWTGNGGMSITSADGASVTVVNTICWSDAYGPGGYDREFHLYDGGTMTATYSDIRNGSCPGGLCTGNVSIDPDFVSYSDSHLNSTSPLIDIAVAYAVTDDIDGDTRPQGADPDIGADEVRPPVIEMTFFVVEKAKIDFKKKPDDDKIHVKGRFELAPEGDDVDISEDVIVTIGPFTETIKMEEKGKGDKWEYKRPKGETGIKHMKIHWKNNEAKFDIRVDKLEDMTWANPVTISIQIGNDIGKEEDILMKVHKHHWDYHKKKH